MVAELGYKLTPLRTRHVHGNGKTGLYRQHSLLVIPNEAYLVRFFFKETNIS